MHILRTQFPLQRAKSYQMESWCNLKSGTLQMKHSKKCELTVILTVDELFPNAFRFHFIGCFTPRVYMHLILYTSYVVFKQMQWTNECSRYSYIISRRFLAILWWLNNIYKLTPSNSELTWNCLGRQLTLESANSRSTGCNSLKCLKRNSSRSIFN